MLYHTYIIIQHLTLLDPNQYSWGENYAGSSGLMSVSPDMNPMQRARSGTVSLLKRQIWRPEAGSLPQGATQTSFSLCCWFIGFYFTHFLLSNLYYFYIWALFHIFYLLLYGNTITTVLTESISIIRTHSLICDYLSFSFPLHTFSVYLILSVSRKYLRLFHLCALVGWHVAPAHSALFSSYEHSTSVVSHVRCLLGRGQRETRDEEVAIV